MIFITVGPAYQRDYRNKAEVLEDWNSGKDFEILTVGINGKYMSVRDKTDDMQITVRYGKGGRKTLVIQ
jgi:hypothetical protein